MRIIQHILLFLLPFLCCCQKAPKKPVTCNIGNYSSNYFSIQSNEDSPHRAFNIFCKKVKVFGILLYATPTVSDQKLLHAANVMAQYLDNDEDGAPNNQLVINAMVERNACMIMADKEKELKKFFRSNPPDDISAQDLYGEETELTNGSGGQFDASLEEILHLITSIGYANAYPSVWGEQAGSAVANAMDKARGGRFTSIPSSYPTAAWYHYDDKTCEYNCMVTEYVYWAITSNLGGHNFGSRCDEIANEWELCTPAQLQSGDPDIYTLITDSIYGLPTVLPDGNYK